MLLLAACQPRNTSNTSKLPVADKFKPIVNGTWVMTDYINSLAKTKSPVASIGVLTDVVSMSIISAETTGDSLTVSASLNNHEGYLFTVYFREGQNDHSIPTSHDDGIAGNFYELSYAINGKDTTLSLCHYNKEKKLLDERSFTKVTGVQSENGEPYGIQYMANKVLVAGKYKATDESGKQLDVTLTDDGLVNGIEGHSTYYIFTDYIAEEEGYKVDELMFDERTKNQKSFIFSRSNDTLLLYQAVENAERTKMERGKLKYTMVRM